MRAARDGLRCTEEDEQEPFFSCAIILVDLGQSSSIQRLLYSPGRTVNEIPSTPGQYLICRPVPWSAPAPRHRAPGHHRQAATTLARRFELCNMLARMGRAAGGSRLRGSTSSLVDGGPDHLDGVPRQSSHVMSVINRHSVIGIVDSLPLLELEAVARPRAQGRVPSFQLPDARLRHLVFPIHARRV